MSTPALEFELYRRVTHGGSMDWAIAITGGGDLRIVHCTTGQIVRYIDIPRAMFANATKAKDLRIREKLTRDYVYLGVAVVESNRLKLKDHDPPSASAQSDHWEIVRPLERKCIHEKLAWVTHQLNEHVEPDVIEYDGDAVVLRTGVRADGLVQWWVFGFCDEGGIQDSGRGGGQILLKQGLLPRLIMLYMMKCFPEEIRLSDSAGEMRRPQVTRNDEFLGQRVFDYERVLALGARLDLCLGRISLLTCEPETSNRAFWI